MNTPMSNWKTYDSLIINFDLQQTPLFFIIMRLNLKVVLACLCLAVFFVTISFWSRCSDLSLPKSFLPKWDQRIYDGTVLDLGRENQQLHCVYLQEFHRQVILLKRLIVLSIRSTQCRVDEKVMRFMYHFHFYMIILR